MKEKTEKFDVIIIGAGVAGVSTAYYLSKISSGKILIVERESSFAQHASGKNAALFRQAAEHLETSSLIQDSLRVFNDPPQDWAEKSILKKTGSYLIGENKKLTQLLERLKALEIKYDIYPHGSFPPNIPNSLKQTLEQSDYETLAYFPEDGVLDIHALMQNLIHAAKNRKVQFQYQYEVSKIEKTNEGWKISDTKHSQKTFQAKVLVNAGGAWASNLVNTFSKQKFQAYRRHLVISNSNPFPRHEISTWPFVWDISQEYYYRPESNTLLLSPGDEDAFAAIDPPTDPKAIELLAHKLKKFSPVLSSLDIMRTWACLRTKSSDGKFKIEFESTIEGLFWVAALGGHGMSASLGVGKKAAKLLAQRT
ncbi:MAG: FAD-binding oxidoreductase [Deltaproteobacteria bacterium]|nr:FAD-binding oxidoreductase [Deltaproteobacteria bacterium]